MSLLLIKISILTQSYLGMQIAIVLDCLNDYVNWWIETLLRSVWLKKNVVWMIICIFWDDLLHAAEKLDTNESKLYIAFKV